MRLYNIALAITVTVLVGCASSSPSKAFNDLPEAFQHCDLSQVQGWRLIDAPADFETILAIPSGKGTIGTELEHMNDAKPSHEHWFEKDKSHVAVCRHVDTLDSCVSHAMFALVQKADGQWVEDGPVMETVCYFHERRR